MFGHRYFGARYFARRYFGDGGVYIDPGASLTPNNDGRLRTTGNDGRTRLAIS